MESRALIARMVRTLANKLPFVNSYDDRHGRRRHTFRKRGQPGCALPGDYGSPEFMAKYAEALASAARTQAAIAKTPKAGARSMAALVRAYRSSPAFLSLKPSTRRAYNLELNYIEGQWGIFPAAGLTRAKVNELLANRAATPKRANRLHKRLKMVMEFAVDIGWIKTNPVGKRRPFKVAVAGYPTWPESEIEKFHNRWPRGTRERVAFDLILYLGQRSVDTVALARNHVADDGPTKRIRVVQEKTGAILWLKMHPQLRATLDAGPIGGLYFVEIAAGGPRSVKGFYNWLKAAMMAAGMDPALSPHGGRKAAATRIIDGGGSAAQAAAVTGHASLQELENYIKARNQSRLADGAVDLMEIKAGD